MSAVTLVMLAQISLGGASAGGADLEAELLADQEVAMFYGGMGNLSAAKEKKVAGLIVGQLKRWGASGRDLDVLRDFNNLIGIGKVAGVRRGTLSAASAASRAVKEGKNWRRAVGGYVLQGDAPRLTDDNKAKARQLLDQLGQLEGTTAGRTVKTSLGRPENNPLLRCVGESYTLLGVLSEGDDLTSANYRFRVLTGTGEDIAKKDLFDVATYEALKQALQSFADGRDWKAQN